MLGRVGTKIDMPFKGQLHSMRMCKTANEKQSRVGIHTLLNSRCF